MRYIKDNVITSNPTFSNVVNPSHEFILVNGWKVYEEPEPNPYALAMQEWHEPTYPLRIKASVDILNPLHPMAVQIHMFYNYLKAQGLPEHTENGIKYVYVNEIQPEHQEFFNLLEEVEGEHRPRPEDF
ncbi:MAG: hypothetical protein RBT74_17920 [Tenuifilaceae bacterium]|jgi:hypothetical protein|nr:hypothetical protein [Tenuifilaceae bacterium]